jgi:hypothetical protein
MSRLSRDDLSISICRPTELIIGSETRCPNSYRTKPAHLGIYSLRLKRFILLFF